MDAIDDLPVDLGTALEFRNKKHAILIEASVIVSTIKIKGKNQCYISLLSSTKISEHNPPSPKLPHGEQRRERTQIKTVASLRGNKNYQNHLLYLAMYNAHFFAQMVEGKIRMHIMHG